MVISTEDSSAIVTNVIYHVCEASISVKLIVIVISMICSLTGSTVVRPVRNIYAFNFHNSMVISTVISLVIIMIITVMQISLAVGHVEVVRQAAAEVHNRDQSCRCSRRRIRRQPNICVDTLVSTRHKTRYQAGYFGQVLSKM